MKLINWFFRHFRNWANKNVYSRIENRNRLFLGKNVSINYGCYVNAFGTIVIGDNTMIGPNTVILSSGHNDKYDGLNCSKMGTVIGCNCWIGANVTILGGVHIGDGSVVGAGAVVTKDVPPMCVVAGVPARVTKKLSKQ